MYKSYYVAILLVYCTRIPYRTFPTVQQIPFNFFSKIQHFFSFLKSTKFDQKAKPSKISNPYVNLQAGLTIRDVSLLTLYLGIPTKYRVRFCFCPQTYFFIKSQHQKTTQGEPSGNSRPPHIICRFRRSLPPLWTASHTHYHTSDPTPICFQRSIFFYITS